MSQSTGECPVCAAVLPPATASCPLCGLPLDAALALRSVSRDVSSPFSPASPSRAAVSLSPAWPDAASEAAKAGALWCVIGGLALGALGGILGVLIAVGIESEGMEWPLIGAQYGFIVGAVAGSLWGVLEHVGWKLLWGPVFGIASGFIFASLNHLLVGGPGFLPEVTWLDAALLGILAGAVCGLVLGAIRSND